MVQPNISRIWVVVGLTIWVNFNSALISFKVILIDKQQAPSWQWLTSLNLANIWAFGAFRSMSNSGKSALMSSSQLLPETFSTAVFWPSLTCVSTKAATVENIFRSLVTQSADGEPVASVPLGAGSKCRIAACTPALPNQNLHFHEIPRGSVCTLVFNVCGRECEVLVVHGVFPVVGH